MSRERSTGGAGGLVPPAPLSIGEVADPPFAVLPDPKLLFARRSARCTALAPGHHLAPYLEFLARLTSAQHDVASGVPAPVLPSNEKLARARTNGMPPISMGQADLGPDADLAFAGLLQRLAVPELGGTTQAVVAALASASARERRDMMMAVLLDQIPQDAVAAHVLAAAALQVHFAGLSAQLDAASLSMVADGACPACGGAPVSSMIVGWDGAHGARFCTCSVCATHWHVVRIKCLVCSSEKGVAYHALAGGPDTIMGETCEACSSYTKMLHQHKNAALEPVIDDVASLALDMTLQREGWQRASVNPFLLGY